MATKKDDDASAKTVAANTAPADPAPATELVDPSGAIAEPAVLGAVDVQHASVDNNPRTGTSSAQNGVDWNDPARVNPHDEAFKGEGLDLTVYGKGAEG